ncbi:MAG: succinylglutamate desuccinylase [Desulfobaccales bacterium]|jgi:hypothetical protein
MKFKMLLIIILASLLLAAPVAHAEKLLRITNQILKGQETVNSCLAKGERFAVVDAYGLVRILTPEEVDLIRPFNPKAFESRAFSFPYIKEAPSIPPLPVIPEQP